MAEGLNSYRPHLTTMTTQEHYLIAAEMDTPWPTEALANHNQTLPFVEPIFSGYIGATLLSAPQNAPIVEIGAGIGYLGSIIPPQFRPRYIQTEIGEDNCKVAAERNPDLTTMVAPAQELRLPDNSVSAIIGRNVLDMVDTPAVIAEAQRVLMPGGLMLHLRDHRPSLVWINEHCGLNNKQYVPHFDPADRFLRYHVVSQKALSAFLAETPLVTQRELTDPHYQELAGAGYLGTVQSERLKLFSKLAGKYAERQTPPFTTMMDKKLGLWFKQAGFDVAFETFPGVYEMPLATAKARGWPEGANSFEYDNGQFFHYESDLPADAVRVGHTFDAVAAIKGAHKKRATS